MINRIKNGLTHFEQFTYKKYKTLYQDLENNQQPHTLFLSCSDSRVSPERLIDSEPGEVFSIRNIANTVPNLDEYDHDLATASSIEFAVKVLKVKQIIICGHSNCGGCAASLAGDAELSNMPYLQKYLKNLEEVREIVENEYGNLKAAEKSKLMEQLNVVEQLNHLKEYPLIKEAVANGAMEVEGWHYDIGTGSVRVYDEETNTFNNFSG